jgi:ABC-type transport system involved in multi-copper enzyme maturation permease subunit
VSVSRRRIRGVVRNELRAYRRNRSIVYGMSIIPLVFLVQPLVSVFATSTAAAAQLHRHHELLYLLAIPALVPVTLAAYAVVGERQQGTLEPVLSTPIRRNELLLGKALAVFAPSLAIAYAVFGVFLILVAVFAHPSVAPALIRGSDVLAQVIFTPLIAGWSIWLGIAISTRASEVRVAQQLGVLASLPTIAVTTLIAINVIHVTFGLAFGLAAALLLANRLGWRLVSALFDRERLITSTR